MDDDSYVYVCRTTDTNMISRESQDEPYESEMSISDRRSLNLLTIQRELTGQHKPAVTTVSKKQCSNCQGQRSGSSKGLPCSEVL